MVRIDMTKEEGTSGGGSFPLKPATIYCEIRSEEEGRGKKSGNEYVNVRLVDVKTGSHIAYDYIMLEGAAWGLGKKKLKALGVPDGASADVSLIGKRAYVAFKIGEWDGKEKLEVDINKGRGGYWPEDEPPETIDVLDMAPPVADDGDIPF